MIWYDSLILVRYGVLWCNCECSVLCLFLLSLPHWCTNVFVCALPVKQCLMMMMMMMMMIRSDGALSVFCLSVCLSVTLPPALDTGIPLPLLYLCFNYCAVVGVISTDWLCRGDWLSSNAGDNDDLSTPPLMSKRVSVTIAGLLWRGDDSASMVLLGLWTRQRSQQEAQLPQRDSASATHFFLGSLTDRALHRTPHLLYNYIID